MLLYLSLGANLGDRAATLRRALAMLEEEIGSLVRVSRFIETAPQGFASAHPFLNAVAAFECSLTPQEVLQRTQEIERRLGRTQKSLGGVYHDRPIDIDLLLYGGHRLHTPSLILPHPRMHERDFVQIPLQEIWREGEGVERE